MCSKKQQWLPKRQQITVVNKGFNLTNLYYLLDFDKKFLENWGMAKEPRFWQCSVRIQVFFKWHTTNCIN